MFKVLAMLESTAVLADPEFMLFDSLEPEVESLLKERTSPANVGKRVGRDALDAVRLFDGLPHRTDRLLQRLETGDLEFSIRQHDVAVEARRLHRAVDRLTVGITVTLLLVAAGISVLATELADPGSKWPGYLQVLLAVAGVFLLVVGVRTWRSRDR